MRGGWTANIAHIRGRASEDSIFFGDTANSLQRRTGSYPAKSLHAINMDTATSPSPPDVAPGSPAKIWVPIAIFALAWIELISRLRFEWSINPQYGYGWTVPFLAVYLFWQRYQKAPSPSPPDSPIVPGIILVLAGLLLVPIRVVQEANPDWRLLSWAMALSVALMTFCGVYLSGGNRWVRHFAFPILFFFVAVPWPTQIEQLITQGLMRADASINVEILNAIGIPAVQMGNVIEVGSGFVGIDEACAGIRSLQATFMISLFLGDFYALPALRRIILVLAGATLAFVCNLIRTFLLVWLGSEHGSETIKNWHDPAGYTILIVCLFALWGLSFLLQPKEEPGAGPARALAAYRIPRWILGAGLTSIIIAEACTQIWYRLHEPAAAHLQPWKIAWPSQARNWRTVPIAENAQELLRYNEGGGGAWTGEDGHQWNIFFFRWLPGRTAGLFVRNHRPDICLPASGMVQRGSMQSKTLMINEVVLPIRFYVFESNGHTLHVFYCYWDGTVVQPGTADHENWTPRGRLEAVLKGKRDVGTQMLEIIGWGYDDDQKAEQAAIEQLSRIVRRS